MLVAAQVSSTVLTVSPAKISHSIPLAMPLDLLQRGPSRTQSRSRYSGPNGNAERVPRRQRPERARRADCALRQMGSNPDRGHPQVREIGLRGRGEGC
jgi:hypothetical protein